MIEAFEKRQLMAASAVLSPAGVLNIIGTGTNDSISVDRSGTTLRVKLNGLNRSFANGNVKQFNVVLGGGNDTFTATNNVRQKMTVNGDAGNDRIKTGSGNDTILGGSGNDLIDGRNGNDDVFGNDGFDIADYSDRTMSLLVNLDDIANDGARNGGDDNVHSDFESVLTGTGDDIICASRSVVADNFFDGGGGNDEIIGLGGNDRLDGEDGNDTLFGVSGNDTISGRNGNDLVWGDDGDDVLYGDNGNDVLSAGAGDDVMSGYFGDDAMHGGAGNDAFLAGAGVDSMYGGLGNDFFDARDGGVSDSLVGGGGFDRGYFEAADRVAEVRPG